MRGMWLGLPDGIPFVQHHYTDVLSLTPFLYLSLGPIRVVRFRFQLQIPPAGDVLKCPRRHLKLQPQKYKGKER